jgi:hypothetical protein
MLVSHTNTLAALKSRRLYGSLRADCGATCPPAGQVTRRVRY